MKNFKKYIAAATLLLAHNMFAGNPDRSGGAGATQLLINPYAKSAGMLGANAATLIGADAMHFNVGGLGFVKGYEFMASSVTYLQGTGVYLNNATLAIPIGDEGDNVLGLSFTGMQFGDITIRTETQPDGTLGTYTPQFMNLGFAYSRKFSNSISTGVVLRYFSEGLSNVTASGLAVDMGVMYQTALNPKNKIKKEDFRFGMSVRNLGPDAGYSGSGLSLKVLNPVNNAGRTAYFGAEKFNLPALVNISLGYDIRLDKNKDTYFHRLTACGNFNYNAFSQNVVSIGAEYSFKELFMVRGGYMFLERNGSNYLGLYGFDLTSTRFSDNPMVMAFSGGCSVSMPITATGMKLGFDYSYAPTQIFGGIHNVALRLNLPYKKS